MRRRITVQRRYSNKINRQGSQSKIGEKNLKICFLNCIYDAIQFCEKLHAIQIHGKFPIKTSGHLLIWMEKKIRSSSWFSSPSTWWKNVPNGHFGSLKIFFFSYKWKADSCFRSEIYKSEIKLVKNVESEVVEFFFFHRNKECDCLFY